MKYHSVTFLFVLFACIFYFLGMALHAGVFMLFGLVAEIVVWVRILGGGRRRSRK